MDHASKQLGMWLICAWILAGCVSVSPVLPTATPTVALPTLRPTSTHLPAHTPTPTVTVVLTQSAQTGTDAATFLKETYPDYSVLAPGEEFVKTWDIKNTGANIWNENYKLVLDATPQNDALGSLSEIHFPADTLPGGTATLSVPLTAPTTPGTYSVYWKLENERGQTFGVDGDRVWVTIMVCEAGKSCAPPSSSYNSTSAGSITVTLTEFTHDAQSATVKFCMTVPNRYYALRPPVPSLLVDQELAPFLDGGTIQPWGCYFMKYQVSAAQIEQAQHILLSIDAALSMSPPPGAPNDACLAAKPDLIAKYPGLDFQCNFSGAGYYTDLRLPDGMTREEAQQIIFDTIEGAIYGPWELTIK